MLGELARSLELGLCRIPMHRPAHVLDAVAVARFARHADRLDVDIIHGHGSKGGAYARLPALLPTKGKRSAPIRRTAAASIIAEARLCERAYMATERLLTLSTDVFLFRKRLYRRHVSTRGRRQRPNSRRIVANGVSAAEFVPVAPNPDAAEFLYVGELRAAKGIDTLLDAIALAGSQLGAIPARGACRLGPGQGKL